VDRIAGGVWAIRVSAGRLDRPDRTSAKGRRLRLFRCRCLWRRCLWCRGFGAGGVASGAGAWCRWRRFWRWCRGRSRLRRWRRRRRRSWRRLWCWSRGRSFSLRWLWCWPGGLGLVPVHEIGSNHESKDDASQNDSEERPTAGLVVVCHIVVLPLKGRWSRRGRAYRVIHPGSRVGPRKCANFRRICTSAGAPRAPINRLSVSWLHAAIEERGEPDDEGEVHEYRIKRGITGDRHAEGR
jgi:hypothetical protein